MSWQVITEHGLNRLYEMYLTQELPEFFRNFPDTLPLEPFSLYLTTTGDVLELIEDNTIIGFSTAAFHLKTKIATLSALIELPYQKTGLALKYMKQFAKLAFDQGALKLVCVCSRDDKRTMSLLEKAKFLPEARLRGNCFYQGKIHDELRWSLPKNLYTKYYEDKE